MQLAPESIVRLNLGHLWLAEFPLEIPVHGFLIKHPGGAGLVDTGYGTPLELIKDYRPVNASVAEAWYEIPACYKGNPDAVVGPDDPIIWPRYTEKRPVHMRVPETQAAGLPTRD